MIYRWTRVEGEILFEDKNIYVKDVDPVEIRRKVGMVFQKPNPFPKTIYNNIAYGPKLTSMNTDDLDTLVEQSLKQAVLWDEVKDILNKSAMNSFRRPAAAALHCPGAGDEA